MYVQVRRDIIPIGNFPSVKSAGSAMESLLVVMASGSDVLWINYLEKLC
jgi:hypothetical protein